MKITKWIAALAAGLVIYKMAFRVSIPKGAKAVEPFDAQRYLGKWYEIARLDFKYERDMDNVVARYSREGDHIRVENSGYNYVKKQWKQSIGKAKFVNRPNEGRLKVSFFGPFYAGYNVIAIDDDYQYALVVGNDLKNIWILSREITIPDHIKQSYLQQAQKLGYPIDQLVWCKHDQPDN